jgi:hypothetical protein
MGEIRHRYKILVWKPKRKIPHIRDARVWAGFVWIRREQEAGSFESWYRSSGSISAGKFLTT